MNRRALGSEFAFSRRASLEHAYLRDLIEVLLPHPQGLRRWSVMQAIRARLKRSGGDVSLKLEDEVERLFRGLCAETCSATHRDPGRKSDAALFYRPQERAGEVWAVDASRASAWLACSEEQMANAN